MNKKKTSGNAKPRAKVQAKPALVARKSKTVGTRKGADAKQAKAAAPSPPAKRIKAAAASSSDRGQAIGDGLAALRRRIEATATAGRKNTKGKKVSVAPDDRKRSDAGAALAQLQADYRRLLQAP